MALDDDADPGQFIAKVLHKLKHTPVDAVGHNFVYGVPDELAEAIALAVASPFSKRLQPLGLKSEFKLRRDDAVLTVQVEAEPSRASLLRMNFHRATATATDAAEAATKWTSDREASKQMCSEIRSIAAGGR